MGGIVAAFVAVIVVVVVDILDRFPDINFALGWKDAEALEIDLLQTKDLLQDRMLLGK
jgi:hypothetical protein